MDKKNTLTYDDYVKGIPKLKPEEQLRLLEIISAQLNKSLGRKTPQHSLSELEGLGSAIWKDIDIQDYLLKERESWG